MLGEVLDGHEILRPLGAGGMGEVFLARAPDGALRALKIVHSGEPQAIGRFRREVRTLERLAHPNIIRCYGTGSTPVGGLYLAMEYVAGPDLQTAVTRSGPYAVGHALAILVQLASALAYAHALGVVHRDLKPGNLILGDGDPARLKIIDFGLAKIAADEGLTRLTEDEQVLGSPLYWAPEQSTHANVGPAADIYALGGIAYFLLSGTAIFGARPAVALVYAHQHEPAEPLARRCAGLELPPGLDEVIAACVAKAPAARPSAAQLVAELEEMRAFAPADAAAPRRKRPFSEAGHSDLAQALTSQMRQVLLDLAAELEVDTTAIDTLQNELTELELELAMIDSDLEIALDELRAALAAKRDEMALRVAAKHDALVDAFRVLYDELATHRDCSSHEAAELFEELDQLDAQFQAAG